MPRFKIVRLHMVKQLQSIVLLFTIGLTMLSCQVICRAQVFDGMHCELDKPSSLKICSMAFQQGKKITFLL